MAKPKLYAVLYRFNEPQADGSVGVAIFNRSRSRAPTEDEQTEINDTCEYACDEIEKGVLVPSEAEFLWNAKPTRQAYTFASKIARDYESLHAWAHSKFRVGLFPAIPTHEEHRTVQ